jgi:hypothetical protein
MATKRKLSVMVEEILKTIPESRDSDITLTIEIWKKYYPEKIKTTSSGEFGVYLNDLFSLPREDAVKRHRAKIQNDFLKFLPTKLEVALQRKLNEEVWRARMGQPKFTKSEERHLGID